MGIAAPSLLNPTASDEAGDFRLSAASPERRAKQRRHILGMVGISYVIDAVILLVYAHAGTVPLWLGPVYALSGLALMALAIAMSEAGINDRFQDHYMVAPLSVANMTIMVVFTYVAPQAGVLFLCSLFTVFSFVSLRSTPVQTATIWTAMALGLAGLFLLTDKPIAMPHGSHVERFATMLVFALTIGRCMFLGLYSSSMQASLYQSRLRLKEAYRRIEELAELDELTGAFNRRCIMRMLDEEIARSARDGSPCSIALIDLDHFKRVNDTYGHPTGDEVLRTFAITVFANIRNIDRFGRYGGEEFLLVLPDLANDGAMHALDRLRAIVADLDWSAFSPGMKVTLSAGVATLRPGETTDNFLARADSALYAAKAQGRNRIARA
jgi:diguanylate cyclase (GGDEF)-like protein